MLRKWRRHVGMKKNEVLVEPIESPLCHLFSLPSQVSSGYSTHLQDVHFKTTGDWKCKLLGRMPLSLSWTCCFWDFSRTTWLFEPKIKADVGLLEIKLGPSLTSATPLGSLWRGPLALPRLWILEPWGHCCRFCYYALWLPKLQLTMSYFSNIRGSCHEHLGNHLSHPYWNFQGEVFSLVGI